MSARRVQPHEVFEVRAIWARLCQLQADVWNAKSDGGDPADCFCGESGYWPLKHGSDYRNSEFAIDYIERAVKRALAEDTLPYGDGAA